MAGGQALTSGQGSFGVGDRQLLLTGIASAGETGFVGAVVLAGAGATFALQSPVAANSVRLRSRKVGGGSATFALTGLSLNADIQSVQAGIGATSPGLEASSGHGSIGKSSARLVSGEVSTVGAGLVTGSGGAQDADWIARSAAAGVFMANRLNDSVMLSWRQQSSPTSLANIVLDTSVFPAGSNGSAKWISLNTHTDSSGQMSIPFGQTFGNGSTVWCSFRIWAPGTHAFQLYPQDAGSGSKLCILSRDINGAAPQGSNQANELVLQLTESLNLILGYWQDGNVSAVHEYESVATSVNANDLKRQPSIDRDANRLTGVNPDTGSAWTTHEQERARYGAILSGYSSSGPANSRRGLGDPFCAGFRFYPSEWLTITQRVVVGTFGSANNRWTVWGARSGQPYVKLWDKQGITLGAGPDYNALSLTNFRSGGVAGGRRVSARTTNINGVTVHTCGPGTPIGDGLLTYTASTGRFAWAGSGQSIGLARAFSASNGINYINVVSGSATDSYLALELVGTLPTTDQNDTISIAEGRSDTQVNYADVICSTQAINAPGGFTVPDDLPTWVPSTIGAWAQIPGTALSSVNPNPPAPGSGGPEGKVDAWTSAALHTQTSDVYLVAGGGHANYAGNEANRLRLAVESPAWSQLRAPSTSVTDGTAYYPDGRPTSRHHYYGTTVDETNNRVMLFGGSGYGSNSSVLSTVDSFSLTSNDYNAAGTHPNFPASIANIELVTCCVDPRNGDVYVFANFNCARWNRAANTWTTLIGNSSGPFIQAKASAFDTTRVRIGILLGSTMQLFNPASNTFSTMTLTGTSIASGSERGMQYVSAIDRWLVREAGSGGTVLQINPATGAVSSFSTSGGGSIPSTSAGPNNKWLYIPALRGCVLIPTHTGNCWFLRVH